MNTGLTNIYNISGNHARRWNLQRQNENCTIQPEENKSLK